jgi:acetyl-CoA carboxylase biotin carboxyl carrier protein
MARREVKSEITGSVWKILKKPGDDVGEEDALMVLESMKMEIPVLAEARGKLKEVLVNEGDSISEGQTLVILEV